MRFAGIDIASETHVVAVVDEHGEPLVRPLPFTEDVAGYGKLLTSIGPPDDLLIAMEATGHYWQNLFAYLVAHDFRIVLLNPLRTHRFSQAELERTKTDAIDALKIARLAAEKRLEPTKLPDVATNELRELVRLRDRLVQDFTDRVRQLHRLVDLGFPEFTRYVRSLDSQLASSLLHSFPTAAAFASVSPRKLAKLVYDGRRSVGDELAKALIAAAAVSVGQHHGEPYRIQVRYTCEDLDTLRKRIRDIERDIERALQSHDVGRLLTTIPGIGPLTAGRLLGELDDPAHFDSAAALAAYVGVVPGLKQSGKNRSMHGRLAPIGHAALRRSLWMPTLSAVRTNPWLRNYYQRLRAAGKPAKVALVAAMRKLLTAVYSVAKNRRPFVPILGVAAT